MARLRTDALKPGMILAEDLKHANGRFLLASGVKLEPSHLRVLKIWGIERVQIQDISEDAPTETVERIDPGLLREAEIVTRDKFSLANLDHPFFQEIFPICVQRLARRMGQEPGGVSEEKKTEEEIPACPEALSPSLPPENYKNPEFLVGEDIRLASLPNIFFEITKVISDPRSSAVHIADVISKDPSLTARLLKVVNSAFYSFPSAIDTISRAVMIVGSKQLSALALGTSVISIFQDIPSDLVDMKSFWEHSLSCGMAARILASYKAIPNTERLFVAGLLHDIGRLILYKHLPHRERETLLQTKRSNCLLRSAEMDLLGFDHTVVGGILLRKWKLPVILEHAVEYHHTPLESQHPMEASIVYLADILTNALGLGTSGERFTPAILPEVWDRLDLPTEAFPKIIQFIDRQVEEVIQKFFDGC